MYWSNQHPGNNDKRITKLRYDYNIKLIVKKNTKLQGRCMTTKVVNYVIFWPIMLFSNAQKIPNNAPEVHH